MILADATVFVYAYRRDSERHGEYSSWLESALGSDDAFGFSELVLSSFLRIVTHPRIFARPTSIKDALDFTDAVRKSPNAIRISPQEGHWPIFSKLCAGAGAKANLIPDAYLAALAIESGSTWITCDRDFARFKGLKWRHPLED